MFASSLLFLFDYFPIEYRTGIWGPSFLLLPFLFVMILLVSGHSCGIRFSLFPRPSRNSQTKKYNLKSWAIGVN